MCSKSSYVKLLAKFNIFGHVDILICKEQNIQSIFFQHLGKRKSSLGRSFRRANFLSKCFSIIFVVIFALSFLFWSRWWYFAFFIFCFALRFDAKLLEQPIVQQFDLGFSRFPLQQQSGKK